MGYLPLSRVSKILSPRPRALSRKFGLAMIVGLSCAFGLAQPPSRPSGPFHLVPPYLSSLMNLKLQTVGHCIVEDFQEHITREYKVTTYYFGCSERILHIQSQEAEILAYGNYDKQITDYWMRGCDSYIIYFPRGSFELRLESLAAYGELFDCARCLYVGCGFKSFDVIKDDDITTVALTSYDDNLEATSVALLVFSGNNLSESIRLAEHTARYDKTGKLRRRAGPKSVVCYEQFSDYQDWHGLSLPRQATFQDHPTNPSRYRFRRWVDSVTLLPTDASAKQVIDRIASRLPHRVCSRKMRLDIIRALRAPSFLMQLCVISAILVAGAFYIGKKVFLASPPNRHKR